MNLVKIEIASRQNLEIGEKIYAEILENSLIDENEGNIDVRKRFTLKFVDKNRKTCGFGIGVSPNSRFNTEDIIQAIYDLSNKDKSDVKQYVLDVDKMSAFNKNLKFEVVDKPEMVIRGRNIFSVKLLDDIIASKIIKNEACNENGGLESETLITEEEIDKLASSCDEKLRVKMVLLDVKGDIKSNPMRTTISKALKNLECPDLQIVLDENSKFRTEYKGEYAGEILNVPTDLKLENIISLKANTFIPYGYTIELKYKGDIVDSKNSLDEEVDNNDSFEQLSLLQEDLAVTKESVIDKRDNLVSSKNTVLNKISNVENILDDILGLEFNNDDLNSDVLNNFSKKFDKISKKLGLSLLANDSHSSTKDTNSNLNIETISKINNDNLDKIALRCDKEERVKIITYLKQSNIPEYLINRIIDSHEPFKIKYHHRIPISTSPGFTPWKQPEGCQNLLLQAIVQIEEGLNPRFVGDRGTGKDALSKTIAWIYQRPEYTQPVSGDTDITMLVGDKDLEPKIVNGTPIQDTTFEIGLLLEAMQVGGIYIFSEGNACKPEVTMALHSVLDDNRSIDVKGYGVVKAHPRFTFILTMNPGYDGCNYLNQAFQDRFATIKFPSPKDISKILEINCPYAKKEHIRLCNRVYKTLLDLSAELQLDDVVTIRGYIHTLKTARHLDISTALEMCVVNNISDDPQIVEKIRGTVENLIP